MSSITGSAGRRRRSGRLDVFHSAPPTVTGFYLIDSLHRAAISRPSARRWRSSSLPAVTLGDLLAGADRAHDARLDAGGAGVGFRAHRAGERALDSRTVIITYAFRNAMLPVVTTLGMVFSFLLGANVLVEKVFAWPGIGSYAVEALITSDFAPVQGFVLTMAILYVVLNLVIDMLYGVIDPRVRIEG